jgi:Flp pilus assembly pilin Flp
MLWPNEKEVGQGLVEYALIIAFIAIAIIAAVILFRDNLLVYYYTEIIDVFRAATNPG